MRQQSDNIWRFLRSYLHLLCIILKLLFIMIICSSKTLKHIFWKFPHKPAGSRSFITGTIYYKIWHKCNFSCYFKTGQVQGMKRYSFHSGSKLYKFSNITKDLAADVVKMETKLINPLNFHEIDFNYCYYYRIFHPLDYIVGKGVHTPSPLF